MATDPTAANVTALVQDLLPVLVPQASLSDAGEVSIPVGEGQRLTASLAVIVDECRHEPQQHWPRMVDSWLRAIQEQVVDGSAPSDLAVVRSGLRARVVPRMQPEVAAVVVQATGRAAGGRPAARRRAGARGLQGVSGCPGLAGAGRDPRPPLKEYDGRHDNQRTDRLDRT